MKNVPLSTDVFAAIWARRQPGQDSEDAILRAILGLQEERRGSSNPLTDGFHDQRNDVHFPEGFEIFRFYKGRRYSAVATAGRWLLEQDGVSYPSLHKLSLAVVSGNENSWNNWKYKTPDGGEAIIDALRPINRLA